MKTPRGRLLSDTQLVVTGLRAGATVGLLRCRAWRLACALGRSGRRALKREGDGATPIGTFALRGVFYRPDRVPRPRTGLPVSPLRPDDGWCDDPEDRNYNRRIRHPYPASAERLWRDDHLYDVVVVLGHNDRPRTKGRGSAVFMHVAGPGLAPTEGCIAVPLSQLVRLIGGLERGARIRVEG
jgi:L,D-peptidoglycan transpeptidase YkuD (ErfK/YbiS/YcfS/YnhG family)